MEVPSSPCGAYWEPDGKQHLGYAESIKLVLMQMFLEGKHFANISRGHACKWPVQLDHFAHFVVTGAVTDSLCAMDVFQTVGHNEFVDDDVPWTKLRCKKNDTPLQRFCCESGHQHICTICPRWTQHFLAPRRQLGAEV